MLGSILAQAYRNQLGPHLSALPAADAERRHQFDHREPGGGRRSWARRAGTCAAFADTSFVHAMHLTTLISAAITLLGALVVMRWMPGRAAAGAARQATAGGGARQATAGASARGAAPANGAVPANEAVLVGDATPTGEAVAERPGAPAVREG